MNNFENMISLLSKGLPIRKETFLPLLPCKDFCTSLLYVIILLPDVSAFLGFPDKIMNVHWVGQHQY